MGQNIIFINTSQHVDLEQPQPASNFIPNWYKNMESYTSKEKKPNGSGGTNATIKRCMPVYDAMTAGYIITLPADVYVSIKEYEPRDGKTGELVEDLPVKKYQHFEWSNFGLINFHSIEQAPEHPARNEHPYAKWMNPWAIKTPKGYSTLFVQPMHRKALFTIMPGIVDTDEYFAPVNFPFTINDPNFEGFISKGTPIAQVIPFKREGWQMKIGSNKEFEEQYNITQKLKTKFFDRYKSMFWNRKEYK
jgi:hypothetical protein